MASFVSNNLPAALMGLASSPAAVGLAAGALGASMYLDARHNVVADLKIINQGISIAKYIQQQVELGRNHCLTRFQESVARLPGKCAIRGSDFREWTYAQADKSSTRIAAYLLDKVGIQSGDTVALMFENNPQILLCMLGIFKARCVMTPQNTNLRGAALLHCLRISGSKVLIFESVYNSAVNEILPDIQKLGIKIVFWSHTDDVPNIKEERPTFKVHSTLSETILERSKADLDQPERIAKIIKDTKPTDPAYVIYTSGTTGLPKGGLRDHFALIGLLAPNNPISMEFPKEHDVMVGASPLYHTQAFIPFMLSMSNGATFVPLRKFSASRFWQQCIDYQVTSFWYIGEMLRYLTVQPPRPTDRAHKVRRIGGVGLRKDIFREFFDRFGMEIILEFYAASDGTSSIFHAYYGGVEGIGSVGRRGPLLRWISGAPRLIKVDEATEEPVRDPVSGLCIEAKVGEAGDCIGLYEVGGPGQPTYKNNDAATNKKILRDVFVKGDTWWRMGDLLMRDANDWYYFKDRIGDTYRWKSENVSTMEVGNLLMEYKGLQEANVYGVEVPGNDGRAGMAAVVLHENSKMRNRDEVMAELGRHVLDDATWRL
ncbi:acetyl-CoA synthetase-like protein [Gonapodya prolifera JEL478]|uniref:Acetyl-CoA synthetase-like protein n=1 Tax=Gonapodya prolifera (strain JEL478) TaxID=1344416 RepID=A0A139AFV5_GONPJ|nr:acetyl-CoA synthetase-like protein [Gonapodya prolifera JEL478]|eukprot:KXS15702.1 acetyl-CoA synthetase-like protein [Gonapodya prolifera JEL478]